ncbi:MAG: S8 family serine peptidase [candidate division KSB1 bacterium]|nr:S8 family serine peptidase [candidate division KSB1 bacterium]MDZ7317852.1 S8 family serine peptidase [candidate division KSB1 bacterium]MDZ7340346.1 S8 family serine peptidase [candidate division KSB1 bacterium]
MKFKIYLAALFIMAAMIPQTILSGQLALGDYQKLDPRLAMILDHPELKPILSQQIANRAFGQPTQSINVLIKSSLCRSELNALGISVLSQFGNIVAASLELEHIPRIIGHPAIEYIQAPRIATIANDVSVAEIGTLKVRQQYNLTGKGVIIGIIDTGIDWRHADFRKSDGTTRIKALLDLTERGQDAWGGTLHTEQEINNALNGSGNVTEKDYVGHGTHVAGSAAGNGRATGNSIPANTYVGVAPEADLIIVKATTDKYSINFESTQYLSAISFIDSLATLWKQPYVINMSLGSSLGPHDGKDLSEQAIDNLLKENSGRGRSIVISAGNDGDDDIHASGIFSSSVTSFEVQFNVPSYTVNADNSNDYVVFEGWYKGIYSYSVKIITPSGLTTSTVSAGQERSYDLSDGAIYIANAYGGASKLNGDKQIVIQVFDYFANKPPKQGTWKIFIYGTAGKFDLWLSGSSMGASISTNIDRTMIVGTPGTAFQAITVGAYVSKRSWTDLDGNRLQNPNLIIGGESGFSSPGPTRDGRVKPEISAPGEMIAASYSADASPSSQYSIFKSGYSQWPNAYVVRDGKHAITQGTSFAAPHVAGAIALMLQQHPTKTVAEIRQAIISTARKDSYTGNVPNSKWGYGKIDVAAALQLLPVDLAAPNRTVPGNIELLQNYPNPFNPTTTISYAIDSYTEVQLTIFNLRGQKIRTLVDEQQSPGRHQVTWDGMDELDRAVASGVYFYRLTAGNFSQTKKMILLP